MSDNASEGSGDSCFWGDAYSTKSKQVFRFAFQNINGMLNDGELKFRSLHNHITDYNIDIFGAVEANANWSKTQALQERMMGRFEMQRIGTAYLTAFPFGQVYQPGGTFIMARDQMAARSYKT